MKDVQERKTISMVGQPGLLLALALVILAAVGWLNYRDSSAYAVIAKRLFTVQLAAAILACLLLLWAFVLLKWQYLVRYRTEGALRASEAVRQSEERLSLAVAAADLGTWDWDIRSDHLVWSPRHLELFGLSSGTPITYQRFLEANHPEDRERIDQAVRGAIERHEDCDVEMRTVWPDSTIHFVAGLGRAYYDPSGRPTRMTGVAMDITKRKQAEEAVRQSEERFSLAIAAADLGTWDWNILSDESVSSPRCYELFGLSSGARATRYDFRDAIHPEDRDRIERAVHAAVEQHEDYDVHMRVVWPDGTVRSLAARGRAHYDPSG
ncbi:MAG: domain S-box, partial [Bradyrhizobium sp.]|nr:domain S-box [Bradyrhizobium sp.]